MLQREQPRVVAIAPDNPVSIKTDRTNRYRLERADFARLQDAKRIRRLGAFLPAAGARAVGAQMRPEVDAAMAIVPFDDQTLLAFLLERDGTQRGNGHGDS